MIGLKHQRNYKQTSKYNTARLVRQAVSTEGSACNGPGAGRHELAEVRGEGRTPDFDVQSLWARMRARLVALPQVYRRVVAGLGVRLQTQPIDRRGDSERAEEREQL